MVKITLLGGKGEIGGNKILIEHKGTSVFLDFGMSFKQFGKFFSEFLNPRKCSALEDFFEFALLPKMKGLYREDYVKKTGLKPEKKAVDAVFLSHAHADHAQYIHFLRLDIPIYCSEESKIILQCLEETGSGSFTDFVTMTEDYCFYKNKKGGLSRVTSRNEEFVHARDLKVMKPFEKVKVGSLVVEMMPVDHSLPGAAGFIIYTSEGNIVYTGDIRFTGYHGKESFKFVEKAASVKPRWLICEGTRIDSDRTDNEDDVSKEMSKRIAEAKALVFVEHPIRDIDRVYSIFRAAKECKREFAVDMKLAYLIEKLGRLCPFSVDDVKIIVYRKSWGLVTKDVDKGLIGGDYDAWERDYIFRRNAITYKDLVKNPAKYVVSMNLWNINQLVDIKPINAIWIKSNCEPFCEEMELDEERKDNWLEHFKVKKYSAHCSGHACGKEIRKMITQINAEHVIAVHTEKREMVEKVKI